MNKKLIWIIIAAVVVIGVVIGIIVANNNDSSNGGNGGAGDMNASTEITDTSIEGDVVEGSSVVVTDIKDGSLGAKITIVNAGDTMQNHLIVATFYDADGNVIATGDAAATLESGESKETILAIDGDWEEYASVKYTVKE